MSPQAAEPGGRAEGSGAPPSWLRRLEDPTEPLYTVGVVSDLLGLDTQSLRRLGETISHSSTRSSGNHRRYSRRDIEALAAAAQLSAKGFSGDALAEIHRLEREIEDLSSRLER